MNEIANTVKLRSASGVTKGPSISGQPPSPPSPARSRGSGLVPSARASGDAFTQRPLSSGSSLGLARGWHGDHGQSWGSQGAAIPESTTPQPRGRPWGDHYETCAVTLEPRGGPGVNI